MDYFFDSEVVGVVRVEGENVRFAYQGGVVSAAGEREKFILEWLRSRGLCRVAEPVVED